jgi:peptide/nickel transport system substrate-binding protein
VNKKARNNPLVVMDLLQAIRIVPAHIMLPKLKEVNDNFSEIQKLKFDSLPVVSGPYNLLTYSNEKIVLKRRDDYWGNAALHAGKMPGPQFMIHPIYKSNDHFSIALTQGDLDASQTFIPRIWIKKSQGVSTWYEKEPYFVPGAIPMLLINHTRYPLTDKTFRRAMANAIDYKSIKNLAVSGYSPDIKPGIVMPFGIESKYYNEEDAMTHGASFDPEKAKKILSEAGYKSIFKEDGSLDHMENAKGERVPTLFVKSPAGWSDWEAIVTIAVKGMRAAGIDVREGFVDAGLYWQSQPSGDFDLEMHKPASTVTPSLPWNRFEALMSSRNWKKVGDKMNENQGRYNEPGSKNYNAKVDSLLNVIPTLSDEESKLKAYRELNIIFMEDQVALPLCYLPEQFYEFSTKNWVNWPTEKNPYAPPQLPWASAASKVLWELQPVK